MTLLQETRAYKPFSYPWAYDAWLMQQRIHWLPEEVPLADDVNDWRHKLTEKERNLLTHIFRFFTQADIEVNDCYMTHYAAIFKPVEVKMMLAAFSNIETVHIAAYSHLLDTIGMPEAEYEAFLSYKEMRNKYDFLQSAKNSKAHGDIALTLAIFGALTEGLQLFATFAILMNFQRFNKMKGMGQIVAWSVRDESLHCASIIRLYHTFIQENQHAIDLKGLHAWIKAAAETVNMNEKAFLGLVFEMGDIEGLSRKQMEEYVDYITERRLLQLQVITPAECTHAENPLPWMDEIMNGVEHANFFEARSTEYTKAATKGKWEDVF